MRAAQPVRTENMPAKAQDPAMAAQQAFGNQAVQRMLESRAVQAKLEVTPPGDAYEQEAERVADQVTSSAPKAGAPSSAIQTKPEIHRLPAVQREAKADSKDEKKKPDAKKPDDKKADAKKPEAKKKEESKGGDRKKDEKKKDDKVKRAAEEQAEEKDDKKEKKDEDQMHRAAEGAEAVPEVSPAMERTLDLQRGAGQPLADSQRAFYEPRLGHHLSGVRPHTDAQESVVEGKS